VNGFGAIARQHGEVMDLAGGTGLDHQAGGRAQALAHQVLVDRRQGQQRGDRELGRADIAVADDQDVVATLDRVDGLGAQGSQLGLDAFLAPADGIGDVDGRALELALGLGFDVAQLGHVLEVKDGLADLEPHRRVDLVDVEQVGLGADEGHQRHHDRLADRVDRRVGHLGEQLLEVVVERLVLGREHGQRAVVAHRADAFLAVLCHRRHQELDVFLGHAEGLLAVQQRGRDAFHRGDRGFLDHGLGVDLAGDRLHHVIETDAQVLDPLLVGLGVGEVGFQLLVVDHAALLEVDQEHLARLQAPLAHDLAVGHRQHAGFGTHDDEIVIGHAVAGRTQAVAVQRGADLAAIGEHDRGRAVPRLEHGGVVFVEGATARVHRAVLLPRLGDHHHDGLADRVAGHRQQLEAVVEGGGVGLAGEADRVQLAQVLAQHRRGHHAFARLHPVVVALDRVDLAVVGDIAVGVGQRPLGEGVGREALVHQAQRRDAARVLQVEVVGTDLVRQQQALVHHGTAGHAGDVVLVAVLETQGLDIGTGGLADHVELALERVLHDHIGAAADEDLAHDRLLLAHGGRHRHLEVDRHIAPAQQDLALGLDRALHLLLASQAGSMLLGQEDEADAVLASRRQGHALLGHLFAIQLVGDLDQQTGAIAHQRIGTDGAPVIQVLEDLEGLADDGMALLALDMGHEADAAGVMFLGRAVQTLLLQLSDFGRTGHAKLLN
jgi:hypothetical protein